MIYNFLGKCYISTWYFIKFDVVKWSCNETLQKQAVVQIKDFQFEYVCYCIGKQVTEYTSSKNPFGTTKINTSQKGGWNE